jgi:hypothetical protein
LSSVAWTGRPSSAKAGADHAELVLHCVGSAAGAPAGIEFDRHWERKK